MKATKAIAKLMLVTFLPLTQAVAEETAFNNTLDSQQSSVATLDSQQSSVASTEPDIYHFCNNDGEITTSSTALKQWLLASWDENKVNDAFDMFKQYYSASNMGGGVKALFDTFKQDSFNLPEDDDQSSKSRFVKAFLRDIEGIRAANVIQSVAFLEYFSDHLSAVTISESEVITFPGGRYDQPQYAVLPQQTPVALVGQFGDKTYHWNPEIRNGETSWVMVWHAQGFSLIKAGNLAVVNDRSGGYAELFKNSEIECIGPGVTVYDRLYNSSPKSSLPTPVIMVKGVRYMPEIEYNRYDAFRALDPVIWNFAEHKTNYFDLKQVEQAAACHSNNEYYAGYHNDLECKGAPNAGNRADKSGTQMND